MDVGICAPGDGVGLAFGRDAVVGDHLFLQGHRRWERGFLKEGSGWM